MDNFDLSKVKMDASGNVMIGDESVNPQFLSQDGYNQAVQFAASGTTTPPIASTMTAVPPSTLSPYFPSSNGTGAAPTGQGMDPSSFQSLLGQVGLTLQNNNQLATYKSLLSKHLFDSPLTSQELAALPPDIQKIVQSGDPDALQLQMRVLNDQIAGRTKTLDSSISYLTQGYQTAQQQQKDAYTTVLNYAKALNATPSSVLKALYPNLVNNIPADQLAALDALGKPLLTSTQVPTEGTGGGLSLADALVGQESGGDYSAVNPLSGALGKYQIMPEHLTDLGLDPNNPTDVQKFLNSPSMQDQEFQNIMNNLQTTYAGNEDQMIAAYYGGDAAAQIVGTPAADAPQPGGYPSINSYVAQVKARMQPTVDPTVQAYVDGIKNGTITSIAQVPAAYKNQVAQAMDSQNVSTPLADRRYTMAANAIITNYINLPEYQLTANALPYILKIDAAMTVPGSVSDQELLDSFTKLSTAGGMISDSQIKVITGGQTYADMANVLSKKLEQGGILSDDQRNQIYKIAQASYANLKKGYQPIYDKASAQLQESGIPQQYWTLPDLSTLSSQTEAAVNGPNSTSNNGDTSNVSSILSKYGIQ